MSVATCLAAAVVVVLGALSGCGPDADPTNCSPGERACACTPLGACNGELVCHSQQCVEAHEARVYVDVAGARACEVLVQEDRGTIADVAFASGVRGTHARRGTKASIVFMSEADSDLTGSGVAVRWVGNVSRPDFTVVESECFDRLGVTIVGATVSIR